jgi:iron complex outermembrane receptor protein
MTSLISASCAVAALWLAAASVPLHAQTDPVPALPEVVVSASRFKESAQSLPYGVSVITASDIERAGITSVNQALMKLLGVPGRVDFYGGGDYALDLRGFGSTASSNQVYVLDGIRINEEDTGGTRLAGIGIDTVERIEVIHGSGAVMYGASATGGVILVTTKAGRGKQRANSARLYEGFGSFGMRDQRVSATLNSGEFAIDLDGSGLRTNNHRDNFKSDQVNRAVTGQWSNDWLRAGVRYSDDKLFAGLPGDLTATEFATNPTQAKAADINKAAVISNERASVFGQAYLDTWQFGVDVGERNKRLDSKDNGAPTYQYVIDAQNANFRARNEMQWGKTQNALTVGYDQNEWTRKVLGSFGSTARQSSDGVYLQNDLSLPIGLRVSTGVRAETTSLRDTSSATDSKQSQRAWSMGLSQSLSGGFTAFGNVGMSFRLPNVDEVGFTLPGQTLKAQSSNDLELGGRWVGSQSRTEVRFYRNALTNELAYDGTVANSNSFSGFGANVNLDPTLRQGLEVQTKHQFAKNVEALLNLAWRKSKFSEGVHAGKDMPLAPNATVAATAIWSAAAGHIVNLGLNWVSSQSADINNQCSIPSYATWSTGYSYQMRNMELSLGISNLTDLKYYTQAYSCTAGVTNGIYPEAGRAWTAAARFTF